LENRPELTPESDISASSQFGVSGSITINNPTADSSLGIVELPQDPVDPSQEIARGCDAIGDNQFAVTGRGGLPADPTRRFEGDHTWTDVRDLSEFRQSGAEVAAPPTPEPALAEATTWVVREDGRVELVALGESDRVSPSHCQPSMVGNG
jgi:large exoprotein involved in heme utilization and adhesion